MPGDEQKPFTLRLPAELHNEMVAAAKADHISLNSALIQAAQHWLRARAAADPESAAPVPVAMVGTALDRIGHVLTELLEVFELPPEDRESYAAAVASVTATGRRLMLDPAPF